MKKSAQLFTLAIPASFLLLTGCGNDQQPKPAAGGSPLDTRGDYLSTVVKNEASAIKNIDTASLKKAIDEFNVQEGRLPKSLDELVQTKFISEVPAAPAGMKIDYDPATGLVKVVPK
jgi:hypothetical protein